MKSNFAKKYHKILSKEFPTFLDKYLNIPILSRLKGVGLLCGTDWTPFFNNRFFYSRFDHSVGVALIIWNFTHDKAQTIAGLLHDVSTPAFSHVSDFRKGDSLTQTATEENNSLLLANSKELLDCLKQDGLTLDQVDDYHKYPIADNEVPGLSADRLEYMFPSGAALSGTWSLKKSFTLKEIKLIYNDLTICKNESGLDELCFNTLSVAELYVSRTTDIALFLQHNEDITTMQFLATILNIAIECNFLKEEDFFNFSEKEIIKKLNLLIKENKSVPTEKGFSQNSTIEKLCVYYRTFKKYKKIVRSEKILQNYFCVNLKVKKRYINPLVKIDLTKAENSNALLQNSTRITELSKTAKNKIEYFLKFVDAPYGCVKLV